MRKLLHTPTAQPASDGAGVSIHRLKDTALMNPFLMLDEINSDSAVDYLAGFPAHPHRGFETITYMKVGRMRHKDHMGNEGVIESGGVQWMSAARGVIHSEMPEQDAGRMHGFQLWLNLPAAEKMLPADYRDIPNEELSRVTVGNSQVQVIAGTVRVADESLTGPLPERSTQPVIFDAMLAAGESMDAEFAIDQQALVYIYDGEVSGHTRRTLAVYSPGENLTLTGGNTGGGALVLSGLPLAEPVVQYGPFVMNSEAEVRQAVQDYNLGRLTA